ncbi:hypothetical protein FKW77_007078 [Venturia effusa]|uniref:Uncharacterized protein n=1 Tax=Venturia effusa TaxID=50376 RepID=A0A517LKH2_9PEZI|nr:hypothetical protein FKW77_007078 [Venturia effusa]
MEHSKHSSTTGSMEEELYRLLGIGHAVTNDKQDLSFEQFMAFQSHAAELVCMIRRIGLERFEAFMKDFDVFQIASPSEQEHLFEVAFSFDDFLNDKSRPGHRSFIKNFTKHLYRRVFTTDEGRIGLAEGKILPGDLVCVFDGAYMPFLLRKVPRDDGQDTFNLVGEAFILGLMDGEVDAWGLESRDIILE